MSETTVMKLVKSISTLSLILVCSFISVSPAAGQISESQAIEISIDTPILKLMEIPAARQILEKHLPNLVKVLEEDYDVADYLGSSTLKELSIDDDHVIGFDDELLATMSRELSAAQAEQ